MKKELLILVALGFLASCSTNSDEELPLAGDSILSVKAYTTGVEVRSLKTSWIEGTDQLGVVAVGTGYGKKDTYACSASGWVGSVGDASLKLTDETATVYAFYPGDAVLNGGGSVVNDASNTIGISVSGLVSTGTAADSGDYMYGTSRTGTSGSYDYSTYPTATASQKEVTLYMHHALSRVSFIVNKGAGYTAAGEITRLSLNKTSGFSVSDAATTMNITDGTIGGGTAVDEIGFTNATTPLTANANSTPASTVETLEMLVLPVSDASGITIKLTVDGVEKTATLPTPTTTGWDKGKAYKYVLNISGGTIDISSVEIVSWDIHDVGSVDITDETGTAPKTTVPGMDNASWDSEEAGSANF